MSRLIAVFDTNVLFSGAAWTGAPHRCVELVRSGDIDGVTCQPILDELAGTLAAKLRFTNEQVGEALADLLGFMRLVEIPGVLQAVAADPDDNKVIECAVVAGATHIVTGDRRHLLPIGSYQGIAILDVARFLVLVEGIQDNPEERATRDQ